MELTRGVQSVAKWNRKSLLRACEEVLNRSDCTIELGGVTEAKTTAWGKYDMNPAGEPSNIRFRLDPSKSSLIEGLLHEALHVVLDRYLVGFSEGLEEVVIRAIEEDLWKKGFSPGDVKRWRALIERKIGK